MSLVLSPEKKIAGVLVPVSALRRPGDLGIGDTGALRDLLTWSRCHGLGLVQVLPVNETGADNSPYNAISSTALDPVLLQVDPTTVPDLAETDFNDVCGRFDLEGLRRGPVCYAKVKALKKALLWRAFLVFESHPAPEAAGVAGHSHRAAEFRAFRESQSGWMEDYALFRVLMDLNHTEMWDRWPEEHQSAQQARAWMRTQSPGRQKELGRLMTFHAYVQWVAFSQWAEVKAQADRLGVAVMGDVPIGISYYGADVFARRDIFDLNWSGGAPPERIFKSDPFTEKWGQNWGIPHYRWDVLREKDYDWWRQRVATIRSVFHLFRIDHILGFYRIFSFPWRPQRNDVFLPLSEEEARARTGGRLPGFLPRGDETPEDRAANCHGGETLLKVILEEVGEFSLVGEDLGVVPDYVRPNLRSLGIAGFKIPQWEVAADGRLISGENYERLSIATYATHDHDPLRTMWEKWVETLRRAENGAEEAVAEAEGVRTQMQRLLDYAQTGRKAGPMPYDDALREALIGALFRTNSWIAVVMVADLFGTTERFNVPGAVAESNWTCRLEQPVRAWEEDPELGAKMARVAALIRESGRGLTATLQKEAGEAGEKERGGEVGGGNEPPAGAADMKREGKKRGPGETANSSAVLSL